jgi:hypothetical protein
MDLPVKQQIFDFDFTTEYGKKYEGQFTVICSLNMGQKHNLELEKTRLLGNYVNPTDGLIGIAIVLSNLRVKIIDGPPWWTQSNGGASIDDEETLMSLFNKVQEVEAKWKKDLLEKTRESVEKKDKKKKED